MEISYEIRECLCEKIKECIDKKLCEEYKIIVSATDKYMDVTSFHCSIEPVNNKSLTTAIVDLHVENVTISENYDKVAQNIAENIVLQFRQYLNENSDLRWDWCV